MIVNSLLLKLLEEILRTVLKAILLGQIGMGINPILDIQADQQTVHRKNC
jgi:hypothetical protein